MSLKSIITTALVLATALIIVLGWQPSTAASRKILYRLAPTDSLYSSWTFDPNKVSNKTQEGITKAKNAIEFAENEIDEYYTRRNGFAAATLAFLVLAVALYFKIKEKEK